MCSLCLNRKSDQVSRLIIRFGIDDHHPDIPTGCNVTGVDFNGKLRCIHKGGWQGHAIPKERCTIDKVVAMNDQEGLASFTLKENDLIDLRRSLPFLKDRK